MQINFKLWVVITVGVLISSLIMPRLTQTVQAAQTLNELHQANLDHPDTDIYGNIVRDGQRRFNYLIEQQGAFAKIELDQQNQVIARQSLSTSPFIPAAPAGVESLPVVPHQAVINSNAIFAKEEWRNGLFGSGIGLSRIAVFDIDHDNTLEMIMGGSVGGGFGADNFWYVVKQTAPDTYAQVWVSGSYSTSINRIAVADVNADQIGEIYVGLSNGQIQVFNGASLKQTGVLTAGSTISALVLADVDGDGNTEIVTSDGSKIFVYSATTFALEWTSPAYGIYDLAVGNVDNDPSPEIVSASGYVIDGSSHTLEWQYPASGGFGSLVRLGDVDGDGMSEIIGAAAWNKVTAFDADVKSPKWEIPTSQDIGALLVADVDGDNIPEVLIGDGQWGAVHCYNGLTQAENWTINNPEHGMTDIAIGDVNGDGIVDVMWGAGATSSGPDYLYVADSVSHQIKWQSTHLDGPLSAVAVGDVDDDGQKEIVMVSYQSQSGYADGVIQIFDATTHILKWQSTDLPGINAWSGVNSVLIGDVDNDGQTEFVIATADLYDGVIQVYNGQTHALERQSAKYSSASFTALAVGDVDSDGHTEIVAGQKRETTGATGVYLIVFDGASLTQEWKSIGLDTYWGSVYDIELADVDNDNRIEIIASVAGEKMYAYDGVTHQLDWFASLPAYAVEVSDVDNDGIQEILVGKNNGVVEVYQGTTFTLENSFTLGSGVITGILAADLDLDGSMEWLVSTSNQLAAFRGATSELLWQSDDLGSSLGNFNQLNVDDLDADSKQEIVLGSSFALYQFEILNAASVFRVFLPIISKPAPPPAPRGIYGVVTENGASVAGVSLDLRFYDGVSWSTFTNTTTASDGSYSFTGIPSLSAGQFYYVRYQNTLGGNANRVWTWHTQSLSTFTAGGEAHIGDFDLASITLVSPSTGATVSLPHTFQWTPRSATPSDTYEFDLYDFASGDPYFYTVPPLGYVGAYTLNGMPTGFSPGVQYVWEIWVYSPDGGYGISYETYDVMFSNPGLGILSQQSAFPKHTQRMDGFLKK